MTTTLHATDQLEQLLTIAPGRFGRQMRTITCPDPEMAPPRTATVRRMQERMKSRQFRIDPAVVSGAIVERMLAGQTR
jgi:hypothetical protein